MVSVGGCANCPPTLHPSARTCWIWKNIPLRCEAGQRGARLAASVRRVQPDVPIHVRASFSLCPSFSGQLVAHRVGAHAIQRSAYPKGNYLAAHEAAASPERARQHPTPAVRIVAAALKSGEGTPAMRVRRWPGSTRPAPGMTSATKNGPKSGNRDESRHGGCGLRVSRAAPQEKDARRERARPASPWTQSHESAHEETSAD